MSLIHSFLLLSEIPLYGYTTVCLFIYLLANWLLDCSRFFVFCFFFAIASKAAMNIYVHNEHMLALVLGKYLGMEWLCHKVGMCLTFYETIF